MLSDSRFAALGGDGNNGESLLACEPLLVGGNEYWEMLPPIHKACSYFACAAVARCVVLVAGGGRRDLLGCLVRLRSTEVFDEVFDEMFDRWLQLSCDLPHNVRPSGMDSALLWTTPTSRLHRHICDTE